MADRVALITGITGQDGSYLTELLFKKKYEVHGIIRRTSTFNTDRLDRLYLDPHNPKARLFLHYGDLTDGTGLRRIIETVQPTEVYNLGAQSHVKVSFEQPEYTADVVSLGTLRLLEAVRSYMNSGVNGDRNVRFYQASSSEMFGSSPPPQNEQTFFRPRSPYGVSKVAAHNFAINYREAYDMFISCGILNNHESPRRGETFVTRKITRAVGRIYYGLQDKLFLGNLEAKRDWGFAGDYVEAMWQMLQHDQPEDFVIATGQSFSVRDFVQEAFDYAGFSWNDHVEIDPHYYRPTEIEHLVGDPTKARNLLGWTSKVSFRDLVKMMVDSDMELARQEQTLRKAGHSIPFRGSASR